MQDAEIVDLFWQRNPKAIEESEHKYGAYCGSIALRICTNREDAEECVNDTWFSAWNAMPDKRPARLSPFLGRICRNHALDRLEKAASQKRGGSEAAVALEELGDCLSSADNVEASLEQKELEKSIHQFLSFLSVDERRIFLARYYYLFSIREISERSGFRQSKVKSMLYRIRNRLRAHLEKEGFV